MKICTAGKAEQASAKGMVQSPQKDLGDFSPVTRRPENPKHTSAKRLDETMISGQPFVCLDGFICPEP